MKIYNNLLLNDFFSQLQNIFLFLKKSVEFLVSKETYADVYFSFAQVKECHVTNSKIPSWDFFLYEWKL